MTFKFYLADYKSKETSVVLFIRKGTYGEDDFYTIRINTGVKIRRSDWSSSKQRIKAGVTDNASVNKTLDDKLQQAKNVYTRLAGTNNTVEMVLLKTEVRKAITSTVIEKKEDVEAGFTSLIERFTNEVKEDGTKRSPSTIAKYMNLKRLLNFYSHRSGVELSFENLNKDFFSGFQKFLFEVEEKYSKEIDPTGRGKKIMKRNSVGKMLKVLKQFLKYCNDLELTEVDHFKKLKSFTDNDTLKISLTFEELNQIETLDLSGDLLLSQCRDIFLFLCYTGQRISDVLNMKHDDYEGIFWKLTEQKQGKYRRVVLLPEALTILKRYKKNLPYALPHIPEQIINNNIKEIARQAGITQHEKITSKDSGVLKSHSILRYNLMSTKVGRKTFSTLFEVLGVSDIMIKMNTGHADNSGAYSKYRNIQPENVAEALYFAWENRNERMKRSQEFRKKFSVS